MGTIYQSLTTEDQFKLQERCVQNIHLPVHIELRMHKVIFCIRADSAWNTKVKSKLKEEIRMEKENKFALCDIDSKSLVFV